jgi:ribonuclease H2 subunit A
LGNTTTYQKYLSSLFPAIPTIVVTAKADSKYKIVGAASVAAKVTRDAWIEGWIWEESNNRDKASAGKAEQDSDKMELEEAPPEPEEETSSSLWSNDFGSGYPSGILATIFCFVCDYAKILLRRTRRSKNEGVAS